MSEIFPGTSWISQSSVATANVTTYTVTSTSSESGLVGPMTPEALVTSSPRKTSTSTRSGPMNSRLDSLMQTPIRSISTSTDSGLLELRSTVMSSASTMTELAPVEALHWPLSPSVTSPGVLSPTRTISSSPWLNRLTLLSPMSPVTQQFFPMTREDQWLAARSPTSTKKIATATSETKPLKLAQWVLDLQAEPGQDGGEIVPPVRTDREHTGDGWVPINPTSNLLELDSTETEAEPLELDNTETDETEAEPAKRQDLPTNKNQAGSTSVDSVGTEEDEVVTIGLETESLGTTNVEKEVMMENNETATEELTTEGYKTNKSNQNQSELNIGEMFRTTSRPAMEANPSRLDTDLSKKHGEYVEPEEVRKVKTEEHSKDREGLTAAGTKGTPPTEVIQIKEESEELESKLEIEDTPEKAQEKKLNKVWMQQIIEWPRIMETSLANNDDEETIPWSPHIDTINVHEPGTTSGNDTEITLPWIETIPRVESHKFNSFDERSQNESGSEEGPTVSLPLKTAYVAMKGVKVPLKMTRKKKRRRKTKPKNKMVDKPKIRRQGMDSTPSQKDINQDSTNQEQTPVLIDRTQQ